MKKLIKLLSLKEQFCIINPTLITADDIWQFFLPHLKLKKSPIKIEIDLEKVKEFNEIFPNKKSGTGKHMRCNELELSKSFERFFKDYSYSWDTILEAAYRYVEEEEKNNFQWTLRSKYFVCKLKEKVNVSELAEWAGRVESGDDFEEPKSHSFEPKIY